MRCEHCGKPFPNFPFPYICKYKMSQPSLIRTVNVTRYVTPLREGGSLPAITEADDGFLYVSKFRGAGQGVKALIADLIGGELARAAGMKVPEIVFGILDEAFGRTEPDEEIQELLQASTGMNLGIHYLSGAITFDPVVNTLDPLLASRIVLLDCLLTNVDRTARNTNMLYWQKQLWMIDHGAALYFHHTWMNWEEHAKRPFDHVKDHVLLPYATELEKAGDELRKILTAQTIKDVIKLVPDEWLLMNENISSAAEARDVYSQFLIKRMNILDSLIKNAVYAREALV